MSQFSVMTRSLSRSAGSALKTMGLSSSPSGGPLARKTSRLRSQDGPTIVEHSLLEEKGKNVVPKSESSQTLILEALQSSTLFKDMEHELQVDVMLAMDKLTVAAGHDLIRQGEPGNAFYIIEEGEFNIFIDSNRVTTFRRGGSFGEVALIREQPRAATVTALTNAVCWRLERGSALCHL